MDVIKEIERNVKNDETIYILVRNPGMNERYIDYALKNDKEKLKVLNELKEKKILLLNLVRNFFYDILQIGGNYYTKKVE